MASTEKRAADSSVSPPAKRGSSWRQISIYSSSSSDDSIIIDVPETLDSLETLIFCGFDEEQASTFIVPEWKRQNELFPERDRTLMDEAMHYMRSKILGDQDWHSSLKTLGLSTDLVNRIMNPEFDDIRAGGTPFFWATDSVKEAYFYLCHLAKKTEKVLKADPDRINSPAPNATPKKATKVSANLGRERIDVLWEAARRPGNIEGRTTFYKGGSKWRLENAFGGEHGIDITALLSSPPTDFHPSAAYLYTTKQKEVALRYCRYQAERVPSVEPGLLALALPTSTLPEPLQVFGDDWFDLIWSSRCNRALLQNFGRLPEHLEPYERADILVGEICGTSSDKIERLDNKRELTRITIHVGNRDVRASQYVFTSRKAFDYLITELRAAPEFLWQEPVPSSLSTPKSKGM
ncbi:hypothetical protein DHEL01_v204325 [Diaporthe helianthi]|uniref:Uncharacterized protein n=1 Tax=Diaporthe helianthi TaxID=158607 RepID=A0A2P5I476_DIAHE|nr:hypothetical protein DHEL01_v204325 [Diaporthe helianthi]